MLRLARLLSIGYLVLCLLSVGLMAVWGPLGYAPFPLPLGPSSPVMLRRGIAQVNPSSTTRFPRRTTRSRTSIAVSIGPPITKLIIR